MTRTERANPGNKAPSKKAGGAGAQRGQLSRSLTKLLRHQAENERIPISAGGWIKLDDLLTWKGLERWGTGISVKEIFEVVEEDGRVGKGRFGVKYIGGGNNDESSNKGDTPTRTTEASQSPLDSASKNTPETQSALYHHEQNPSTSPSCYQIRATQGHSIKSVASDELLKPIILTSPESIPTTVVHGTFYGAWSSILKTGGLKSMGRNNVHFATGPSLDEVLNLTGEDTKGMGNKAKVDQVLSQNKVISGMRWDAQLLIYIDLKACLEDVATNNLNMTWWISGNGVVLTEGVALSPPPPSPTVPTAPQSVHTLDDLPDDPTEPIVASKSVKARMERETLQAAEQTNTTSSGIEPSEPTTNTTPTIASQTTKSIPPEPVTPQAIHKDILPSDSNEPILASKSVKTRVHHENTQGPSSSATSAAPAKPAINHPMPTDSQTKIVPMKYWIAVVEIKHGHGIIWRQGEGVVKDLPEKLRNIPLPRGKDRVHGSGGSGSGGAGGRGGKGRGRGQRGGGGGAVRGADGDRDRNEDARHDITDTAV